MNIDLIFLVKILFIFWMGVALHTIWVIHNMDKSNGKTSDR